MFLAQFYSEVEDVNFLITADFQVFLHTQYAINLDVQLIILSGFVWRYM